jgi:hypothetical protein
VPRSALTRLEQLLNIARALIEQRRPWSLAFLETVTTANLAHEDRPLHDYPLQQLQPATGKFSRIVSTPRAHRGEVSYVAILSDDIILK